MPHTTIVGKKDISVQCALNTLQQSSPERSIPNILARKKPPVRQLPGKFCNCKQPPRHVKDPKAKAFLSAFQALFQALFANEKASNDENDEEDKDSLRLDDCNVNDDSNNLHGFLCMVGSLKD
jgi:hypothetical protein